MKCISGILGYQNGLLCFACDPLWATNFNAETGDLLLTQSTCDGVGGGLRFQISTVSSSSPVAACNNFLTAIGPALVEIIDIAIKYLELPPPVCLRLIGV